MEFIQERIPNDEERARFDVAGGHAHDGERRDGSG
jgi:hypothetical protein